MLYNLRDRLAQPELRRLDYYHYNMPLDAIKGGTENPAVCPAAPRCT